MKGAFVPDTLVLTVPAVAGHMTEDAYRFAVIVLTGATTTEPVLTQPTASVTWNA